MTIATAEWIATFHEEGNPANKIHFDIIESGGRTLLVDERGTGTFEFVQTIQRHGKSWNLESTDSKPKTPPKPKDLDREQAIQNLESALKRFPSHDALLAFLSGEPDLEGKINDNYNLSNAEIAEWCAKIAEILAGPLFSQDQLRIKFTGQTIGRDLYIGEQTIPSIAQNEYNGTYRIECHGCRQLNGYEIRQLDILKMRAGLIPMFECGGICGRGR
jgi:hypothetical protein